MFLFPSRLSPTNTSSTHHQSLQRQSDDHIHGVLGLSAPALALGIREEARALAAHVLEDVSSAAGVLRHREGVVLREVQRAIARAVLEVLRVELHRVAVARRDRRAAHHHAVGVHEQARVHLVLLARVVQRHVPRGLVGEHEHEVLRELDPLVEHQHQVLARGHVLLPVGGE